MSAYSIDLTFALHSPVSKAFYSLRILVGIPLCRLDRVVIQYSQLSQGDADDSRADERNVVHRVAVNTLSPVVFLGLPKIPVITSIAPFVAGELHGLIPQLSIQECVMALWKPYKFAKR